MTNIQNSDRKAIMETCEFKFCLGKYDNPLTLEWEKGDNRRMCQGIVVINKIGIFQICSSPVF